MNDLFSEKIGRANLTAQAKIILAKCHAAAVVSVAAAGILLLGRALLHGDDSVLVTTISDDVVHLRSTSDGIFNGTSLPTGAPVAAGMILGNVTNEISATLEMKIEGEIQRSLRVAGGLVKISSSTTGVYEHIRAKESELRMAQLVNLNQSQRIVVPIDGILLEPLRAMSVSRYETVIAAIYPKQGRLQVEIQSPVERLQRLLRRTDFDCVIPGTDGKNYTIKVRPDLGAVQHFIHTDGKGREIRYGKVLCLPLSAIPEAINRPSLLGRLR